jgi:hypothetical protein
MSVTHGLALPQPWAWAILSGELEVANTDLCPPHSLLGKRIGIVGGELWEAWWLLEGLGVKLPRDGLRLSLRCQAQGWLGTAELVGYLRLGPGRKVLGQERPGDDTPFRTRKGVLGPVAWILRRPQLDGATGSVRTIRAFWEDSKGCREALVCYADSHGTEGLSPWHRETLLKMGYAPRKETPI